MIKASLLFIAVFMIPFSQAYAFDVDKKLNLVKRVYNLTPKKCDSKQIASEKIKAGKALFESMSLSGDRDISCSTCHLDDFGSADGLPIAVGVGSSGEGKERYKNNNGALVQRNALSLIGRSNNEFKSFFWDGKVQVEGERVITQFGDSISGKFDNPLALAAILPLVERDEFVGKNNILDENDVQHEATGTYYANRYKAVGLALRKRFDTSETSEDKKIRTLLDKASINLDTLELADIGNLLSIFIADKFACSQSNWDKYLGGDTNALSDAQKTGAILFYGKGRCASCHTGTLFSDYEYHSIGVPQGAFGPHSRHRDIGRAAVTHKNSDLYRFRTPPLIEVALTSPYGHNGSFKTLEEIVTHHFNPIRIYVEKQDYYQADKYISGKLLQSRDTLLGTIDIDSEDEVSAIIEFLKAI